MKHLHTAVRVLMIILFLKRDQKDVVCLIQQQIRIQQFVDYGIKSD